ncbi:MAG: hypothetical protein ACYC3F_05625 [Gemmatimonadaceae bacterium]
MASKRKLSTEELSEHYRQQWGHLRSSCALYDSGDETESRRIAATLRVLLHESRNSHALLGQLGMLDVLFFDTAQDPVTGNLLPTFGLVLIEMIGPRVRFVAPPEGSPPRSTWLIPFEHWWKKEVISIPEQFRFSRRDLVLLMADQDGGAHVDPEIDEHYYRLTRENALGYVAEVNGTVAPVKDVAAASVRQIAQEVLVSLVTPRRVIPADLPESPPMFITSMVKDATTGETRQEQVQVHPVCMCKSGLPYRDCHARGGRNEGKRTEPRST